MIASLTAPAPPTTTHRETPFAVVDTETSGTNPKAQEALSVAVVLLNVQLEEVEHMHVLVQPMRFFEAQGEALVIAGYDAEVWAAHGMQKAAAGVLVNQWLKGRALIAHNLPFDRGFLADLAGAARLSPAWGMRSLCTWAEVKRLRKSGQLQSVRGSLQSVAEALRIDHRREEGEQHSALDDARTCAAMLRHFVREGWTRL